MEIHTPIINKSNKTIHHGTIVDNIKENIKILSRGELVLLGDMIEVRANNITKL